MKGILIRILTALVILASSADVLSAQQSVPCAGNCEWEVMVHHLLEEPEAIYRYDTREAFYNARTEVRKHYKKASDWGAFIILD